MNTSSISMALLKRVSPFSSYLFLNNCNAFLVILRKVYLNNSMDDKNDNDTWLF